MRWNAGLPAFILAGGPSLKTVDVAQLEGRGNVIAVNLAYRLAPFADCLLFADRRFFRTHHAELASHSASLKVMRAAPEIAHNVPGVVVKLYDGKGALSLDKDKLCGLDGGANAINLAFLMGAKLIVTFGLDMKPVGNWHEPHPFKPTPPRIFKDEYIPRHRAMAAELARRNVTVLNCSPGSACDAYPIVTFSEVLDLCPPLVSSAAQGRRNATDSFWKGLPQPAIA